MKTLPNQFAYQGHTLTLIKRTQAAGIWSTTREGESTPGFIVAKIKEQKPITRIMPNGTEATFEHKELLPGESEFGRTAWFFRDEVIARNRFSAVNGRPNSASNTPGHTMTRGEPLDAENCVKMEAVWGEPLNDEEISKKEFKSEVGVQFFDDTP